MDPGPLQLHRHMESFNTHNTGRQGAVGMKEQEESRALLTWGHSGQSMRRTVRGGAGLWGERPNWREIFVHLSTSFSRHWARPCGGKKEPKRCP